MVKTKDRKPALSLRAMIEAGEREEARALTERLQETARLERARGGGVEQAQGRMRITSRDGLMTLFERGGLERPEWEVVLSASQVASLKKCATIPSQETAAARKAARGIRYRPINPGRDTRRFIIDKSPS